MLNPFKHVRIDVILFASFSLIILTLLIIVGLGVYIQSSEQLIENTTLYQERILKNINQQLDILRTSIEQISLTISQNHDLQELLLGKKEMYDKYRLQSNVISSLTNIINSSSNIISIQIYGSVTTPENEQDNVVMLSKELIKSEFWYKEIDKYGELWISKHELQYNFRKYSIISYARTIYSSNFEKIGVLVINVKAQAFESILKGDDPNTVRILLDNRNQPVTKESLLFYSNDLIGYTDSTLMFEGNKSIMYPFNNNGVLSTQKALMVWARSYKDGWMIIEITPWKLIAEKSLNLAIVILILGLSILLPSLALALLISKQLTNPIRCLVKVMSKFNINHADNTKATLPRGYTNEIGYLINRYKKFEDRINKMYMDQKRQLTLQKIAELKALQKSINPHFLYNTLDQLNWMAIEAGQEKISKVLELMGRMFRITLSNGETWITVQEEMDHVLSYIEIQQIRLDNNLKVETDLSQECLGLFIPKLILQPIVENSIVHGFHNMQGGLIKISAKLKNCFLILSVIDNGIGITENWREQRKRKTGGYGLRNIEERLKAYFGSSCTLQTGKIDTGGTKVTIQLPMLIEKPKGGTEYVESSNY